MEVSDKHRKKILYVITKANWGGAQRYVYDLATHLPGGDYEVVVASSASGALIEKLKEKNIRTIAVEGLQRDVSLGADVSSFFALYRLFRKEKPDVVHLNSSKAGGLGAFAARVAGVPRIVFTAHGWAFEEPRRAISRGVIWFASWLTALMSHTVIAVSDYDLNLARGMPFVSHKAVRIYNGIDLHMEFGSGEKIRAAFPQGAKILGTVGELNKNKNHIALIEEARKNPELYVAIVGEGELYSMLERKIKEYGLGNRVKLFGFIPSSEVMKGFDRFALPSLKEALAYVVLEARVAGLPIVANRVGGVGEALDKDLSEFSLEKMVKQTVKLYRV